MVTVTPVEGFREITDGFLLFTFHNVNKRTVHQKGSKTKAKLS